MGASESTLTDKPWRKIVPWNHRQNLEHEILSLIPEIDGDVQVPYYKIMLAGTIGAGKSSFFNSINSIFTSRVVTTRSSAGAAASSVTSQFFEHKILQDRKLLKFRICDTMGLTKDLNETDLNNILAAMDGHVPNKYEFTHGRCFEPTSSEYIENPSIADQAHCIAFVVNAITINMVNKEVWEKLRYLWRALNKRRLPMFVILTHVDEMCEEVRRDARNVYRSIAIKNLVDSVSLKLCGIPGAQIFPVINYKDQTELDDVMDVLSLYALRQMLYAAQANLDNK